MQAGRRTHAPGEEGQVTFSVRLTRDAEADLEQLVDFLLEHELSRDGNDLSLPTQAIAALRSGIATPKTSPFTCRKAGQSPFLRELIVPFGRSGYVALFGIEDETNVSAFAVRHQLEDAYH
jgi:plasmid stabilization system protein ParE